MGYNKHLITCAIISYLAASVHGASDAPGSFIFPPNSNVTYFSQTYLAAVADIPAEIHFEDDMVIEYTLPDDVKAVWVSQMCYDTVNDTQDMNQFNWPFQTAVYNESTGTLLWNLGNGTGQQVFTPEGGQTLEVFNYCLFALYNWTMQSCSWGPFGLLSWNVSGTGQFPLLVSELFKISPAISNGSALIELARTSTQSPAPVTATPANITCPPSGIPATPMSTPTPQMEVIPPLASGIIFPAWTYDPSLGDDDSLGDDSNLAKD